MYFQLQKIFCGFKEQANIRESGEKSRLSAFFHFRKTLMSRVVVICLLIISALAFAGYKAKQAGYQTIAAGAWTVAGLFVVIMLASFAGLIQGF